jgi:2-oxoacid dehydrogenases acyltransferase (catalytic domain)
MLDVTISLDHDLVDGAPAARFARRLADLVESCRRPLILYGAIFTAALVIKELTLFALCHRTAPET